MVSMMGTKTESRWWDAFSGLSIFIGTIKYEPTLLFGCFRREEIMEGKAFGALNLNKQDSTLQSRSGF
jgi:hypothetical protein